MGDSASLPIGLELSIKSGHVGTLENTENQVVT